jgi:hypothetical protein
MAVWPADRPGGPAEGGQARLLHHFVEADEYGLALEEIAGALAQDKIAITGQERGDMLAMARQMTACLRHQRGPVFRAGPCLAARLSRRVGGVPRAPVLSPSLP